MTAEIDSFYQVEISTLTFVDMIQNDSFIRNDFSIDDSIDESTLLATRINNYALSGENAGADKQSRCRRGPCGSDEITSISRWPLITVAITFGRPQITR